MNVTTDVAQNPYSPPRSNVAAAERTDAGLFYVVAPSKFLILMIGTLGLYSVYWFYKNWSLLDRRDKCYWPVARGIFNIFFAHALFREIDALLQRSARTFRWSPGTLATVYVVFSILENLMDRLSAKDIGSPVTDILGLVLMVPTVYTLYTAQRAANVAEGDPTGSTNSAITAANIAWLVLGGLLWILILLGLFVTLAGPTA
jgi:hypothetical protein